MSAETGPARRLWLYHGPEGITSRVVYEEARRLGFIFDVRLPDTKPIELSVKMVGMREADWLALRDACFARCGIDDADRWMRERIVENAVYKRWQADLRAWQMAKGYAAA